MPRCTQPICTHVRYGSSPAWWGLSGNGPQNYVHVSVIASLILFLSTVPSFGQSTASRNVVITELLYAPSPASNEFIELYNRSENPINLGQLAFADENRSFIPVASSDTMLAPDAHVVLARDSAAFATAFPSVDRIVPTGWDALNNGGDTVILRHQPSSTVLDSVSYTPSWGGSDGRSLERIDPAAPSTAATNFATSTADAGATPGRRNSRYNPDETAPTPSFAEQTHSTRVTVTLSEPVQPSSVTPGAFALESTTVRSATLSRDTVVVLSLADPPQHTTLQVTGLRDRVGNTLNSATLSLAHRPKTGDLVINEIMYAPRRDDFDGRPNQVEYIELLNRTDRPLTLNGLTLTDRPDEQGIADTLRPGRKRMLRPRGYGVVAAAPDGSTTASASPLTSAFPEAPLTADSVAYLPADAARLGLTNSGELVRLHRADGTLLAEVEYNPDWHAAGLEETTGTALVRISASGRADTPDNWTSSPVPAGGSPGTQNTVSLSPPEDASPPSITVTPSPFSPKQDGATRIRYALDGVPNLVRARIYDTRGRKVRTLEDARLTGPSGELVWNGRDDAGDTVRVGVYVVLFEAVRPDEGTVIRQKTPVVVARSLK